MNRKNFEKALSIVCDVLKDWKGFWALTGGASLFARGMINETEDIDILMTRECAILSSKSLKQHVLQEMVFLESNNIKSLFGKYQIEGVVVEIMAEVFNKSSDGEWHPHTEWIQHVEMIELGRLSISIPMLSLNYEAKINTILGNFSRVKIINNYLSNIALNNAEPNA
ncbi:MAG: hypothetical protein A2464_02860 [Deltaproteobacteria bacterium RIFOXYC2_FULL_48_10]|nr:MAG: hypothetical protein A2464_02860 [Deltaproteobacteria bacterium RIFOXYC2_FULL_48_10]